MDGAASLSVRPEGCLRQHSQVLSTRLTALVHPSQHRDEHVSVVVHDHFPFVLVEPMEPAYVLLKRPSPRDRHREATGFSTRFRGASRPLAGTRLRNPLAHRGVCGVALKLHAEKKPNFDREVALV